MARKTAFVNEVILKTLNQHQQLVSPEVKKATSLDDEVTEVLQKSNISDYDKAKLYSDVLQKYLTAKEQLHPVTTPTPVITDTPSYKSLYSNESIINTVPVKYKKRAENMLRFLNENEKIKWNKNGRVVYNGEVIPGSNITDLINDQMRNRKTFKPTGASQFSTALKLMNIPTELIGNVKRLTHIPRTSSKRVVHTPSQSYRKKWITI